MSASRSARAARGIALFVAIGVIAAACGATPTSTALPSATAGTATTSPTSTSTSTGTPSTEPAASPTPFPFAAIDGMTCRGTWMNQASGSSGPISITFDLRRDGVVILDVGGTVFGQSGGHLVLPVSLSGSTFRISGAFGFLGSLDVAVNADGTASAVLDQPPALGPGSRETVTSFSLVDGALSIASQLTENGTPVATSTVSAVCTTAT